MKKLLSLTLALVIALALAACTRSPGEPDPAAQPDNGQGSTTPEAPVWHLECKTEVYAEDFQADDGTAVASVSYETPLLVIVDESGTPAQESDEVPETLRTAQAVFNDAFSDYRSGGAGAGGLKADATDWYAQCNEGAGLFIPYSDTLQIARVYETDSFVSVRAFCSLYLGGAHPMDAMLTWNFDKEQACFLSLEDLATDSAALNELIATQILQQITDQGDQDSYFDGFEDTIREKERFEGCFDEGGLTVAFSEYEIAPYAGGIPTFTIPYEALRPVLNERGGALLSL